MLSEDAPLSALTDADAQARLQRTGVVLIACGSVEQHGPHLPAGTDTLIAESIANRVATHLDAIVLPFTPLGITPLHMAYASTVSLRPETFISVLRDVLSSAQLHGARFLAAINWHEGNAPALAVALEDLQRLTGIQCVAVQACYVAADLLRDEAGSLSHGGQIEAMLVLADHPELVHLDRVTSVPDAPKATLRDALRRDRNYQPILSDVREISPEGWHGDPRGATEERGRAALATIAETIASQLVAIREATTS